MIFAPIWILLLKGFILFFPAGCFVGYLYSHFKHVQPLRDEQRSLKHGAEYWESRAIRAEMQCQCKTGHGH